MCQSTVVTPYSLVKISTSTELINCIWFIMVEHCPDLIYFCFAILMSNEKKVKHALSFLFFFFENSIWGIHFQVICELIYIVINYYTCFWKLSSEGFASEWVFLGSALNCLYQAMFISKWKLFSMTGANTKDKYCTCKVYHFGPPQTLGRTVKPLRYSSISV